MLFTKSFCTTLRWNLVTVAARKTDTAFFKGQISGALQPNRSAGMKPGDYDMALIL
jgi:hypothetical protein